jgi:hypothetical protein
MHLKCTDINYCNESYHWHTLLQNHKRIMFFLVLCASNNLNDEKFNRIFFRLAYEKVFAFFSDQKLKNFEDQYFIEWNSLIVFHFKLKNSRIISKYIYIHIIWNRIKITANHFLFNSWDFLQRFQMLTLIWMWWKRIKQILFDVS